MVSNGTRTNALVDQAVDLYFYTTINGNLVDVYDFQSVKIYTSYDDAQNDANAIETISIIDKTAIGTYKYTMSAVSNAGTYYDRVFVIFKSGEAVWNNSRTISPIYINEGEYSGDEILIDFVVEDGQGQLNATSYVTVNEFRQYWINRGVDYTVEATHPADTIKAWLNIATAYIDQHYDFYGYATNYQTQALQWPRTGLRDNKYNLIADNEIPTELKDACCRLAKEAIKTTDLEAKISDGVTAKTIGPVSITYKPGFQQDYKAATNTLRRFIKNGTAIRTVT